MKKSNSKIDQRGLVMILFFIGAILWLWFAFSNPAGQGNALVVAKNTATALALTADSLLGPFPTGTKPTSTPSSTLTATPLISATPSFTPSVTITPTPTITPIITATQRTRNPATATPTETPSVLRPTATRTRIVPTVTVAPPTTAVPPTVIPPTDPPPTDPPPTIEIIPPLIQTILPPFP